MGPSLSEARGPGPSLSEAQGPDPSLPEARIAGPLRGLDSSMLEARGPGPSGPLRAPGPGTIVPVVPPSARYCWSRHIFRFFGNLPLEALIEIETQRTTSFFTQITKP